MLIEDFNTFISDIEKILADSKLSNDEKIILIKKYIIIQCAILEYDESTNLSLSYLCMKHYIEAKKENETKIFTNLLKSYIKKHIETLSSGENSSLIIYDDYGFWKPENTSPNRVKTISLMQIIIDYNFTDMLNLIIAKDDQHVMQSKRFSSRPFMEGDIEPVILAVVGPQIDCLEILLKDGASPDVATAEGDPAICIAACCGFIEIAKMLISYKADPFIRNQEGKDSLVIAIENNHQEFHVQIVKYLKEKNIKIPNSRDDDIKQLGMLYHASKDGDIQNIIMSTKEILERLGKIEPKEFFDIGQNRNMMATQNIIPGINIFRKRREEDKALTHTKNNIIFLSFLFQKLNYKYSNNIYFLGNIQINTRSAISLFYIMNLKHNSRSFELLPDENTTPAFIVMNNIIGLNFLLEKIKSNIPSDQELQKCIDTIFLADVKFGIKKDFNQAFEIESQQKIFFDDAYGLNIMFNGAFLGFMMISSIKELSIRKKIFGPSDNTINKANQALYLAQGVGLTDYSRLYQNTPLTLDMIDSCIDPNLYSKFIIPDFPYDVVTKDVVVNFLKFRFHHRALKEVGCSEDVIRNICGFYIGCKSSRFVQFMYEYFLDSFKQDYKKYNSKGVEYNARGFNAVSKAYCKFRNGSWNQEMKIRIELEKQSDNLHALL